MAARTLEKTTWVSGGPATNLANLDSLEDGDNHQPYNQFAGKKTNYSDNIYSTTLDMSKVSKD